jgi:hypothetical protein
MRKAVFFLLLLYMGLIFPLSANARSEEEYKREIQLLQKQIEKMTTEAEENAQELKETRAAMKDVKDQLKTLIEQQSVAEAQKNKETEEQLAKSLQRIQKLEKDLKNAEEKIEYQKQVIESLKKKKTEGEVDTLKTPEKTAQRIAELEASLADVNAKFIQMANENSLLKSQLAIWQSGQQDRKQDAEIVRLEGELRKAADYINTYTAEIASLKAAKTDLESQLTEITTAKTELEFRLKKMTTTKSDLESQLAENRKEQTREVEQLKSEITKLQASVNEAEQQNAQFTETVADLETQLQQKFSVPEEAKKRIQELTQELQDVKVQLDTQERLKNDYPKLQQEATACRERLATLAKEQERSISLQNQLQDIQLALERSRKELDVVETQNLELKKELQNEVALRQSQEQRVKEISERNKEFEQKYAQGVKELELKEQLLQKTLTDKSLVEKKFDETVGKTQFQVIRTQPSTTPGYESLSGSMRALFPQEIFQFTSGGTITILGWSADRTKIAYQESYEQIGRLWIFNTQTRQSVKLTEWRSPSSSASTNPMSRFAWAPDNDHFLFAIGDPGRYVMYLGNDSKLIGSPVQLNDPDIYFAWSPTRLQFAYFAGSNLIVQDLRGDTLPIQLGHTPGAVGTSLQWSPDGTMIAFSIKQESSFDIFTLTFSKGRQPLLQTLVSSSSDDIQPSWSPDGKNIAFYVRSARYDTKIAVIPVDRSRSPYIVAHNTSLPRFGGPFWLTNTEILYVGEEQLSTSQNSIYTVNIATGRRSAAPMSVLLANYTRQDN